jgi:hypothetical protein
MKCEEASKFHSRVSIVVLILESGGWGKSWRTEWHCCGMQRMNVLSRDRGGYSDVGISVRVVNVSMNSNFPTVESGKYRYRCPDFGGIWASLLYQSTTVVRRHEEQTERRTNCN